MPRKKSYITATDQFCGAGGSSQGAVKAGVEVALALNHWKLAIETHNTNFPNTLHDCTDVSACDPRRYPSTDILITSPECTNHSLAKGQKAVKAQLKMFESGKVDPSAERSRATMWDVCRFAEYHQYNYIIVENVVDARKWVMFEAWLKAMHALGYNHKCVYHNSMHSWPTPQSRDRMYIHFWKKGNKAPNLEFTPLAWCPHCQKNVYSVQTWKKPFHQFGKYKQQYVYCCPNDGKIVDPYYYASFNCIDWTDIGVRIGDRKKPLANNTMERIKYGKKKFPNNPLLLHSLYGVEARGVVRTVDDPLFTQTTLPTQAFALPGVPFIIKLEHSQMVDNVSSCFDVLSTQTNRQSQMLLSYVKSSFEPLFTQTNTQGMAVIQPPFIINNKGTSMASSITDQLGCVTGNSYHGLITNEKWNSFIAQYYTTGHSVNHITEALGTISTVPGSSLLNGDSDDIEDYHYRMLKPQEVKLGMAFDSNYVILGSGRDQVKQCGNAVTPPAMEWQVERAVKSLN